MGVGQQRLGPGPDLRTSSPGELDVEARPPALPGLPVPLLPASWFFVIGRALATSGSKWTLRRAVEEGAPGLLRPPHSPKPRDQQVSHGAQPTPELTSS